MRRGQEGYEEESAEERGVRVLIGPFGKVWCRHGLVENGRRKNPSGALCLFYERGVLNANGFSRRGRSPRPTDLRHVKLDDGYSYA